MSTVTTIQKFVAGELLQVGSGESIGTDDELIASGMIDSLMLMRLIHFVDETFSVEISGSEVVPENFKTINVIAAFVEQKRSG